MRCQPRWVCARLLNVPVFVISFIRGNGGAPRAGTLGVFAHRIEKLADHNGNEDPELKINDIGLTRAAGIVCPGDGALTTTSVLAATGGLDHSSMASYNRHGLREKVIG